MSDVALRELERGVLAGDAAARLRLAAEYERLGRRDDAVAALLPGAGDLDVRRALGALPCWAEPDRAWSHRFVDVPAAARAPELAWVTASGRAEGVLASPLGVVPFGGHAPRRIFDATTGAARARFPDWGVARSIVGEVLLLTGPGRLWGVDLWTGEVLHETRRAAEVLVAGRLVLEIRRRVLQVSRVDDPRQAPVRAWRHEDGAGAIVRFVGRRLALIGGVVDPATGVERFRTGGGGYASADDDGLLVQAGGRSLSHFDRDGRRTWRVPCDQAVVALGPDTFLTVTPGGSPEPVLAAHDRATGRERWRTGPLRGLHARTTTLVRDAVHVVADDRLVALDLATGAERWRADLRALGLAGTRVVLPLGRRLYGVTPDGRAFGLRAAP